MGARYDQVEPHVGIVRVTLAANLTLSSSGEFGPKGVSLDANGRMVVGTAGQSGLIGVLIKNVPMVPAGFMTDAIVVNNWMGARQGDRVDVMTLGEILDVEGLVAGTEYFVEPDGDLTTDSDDGNNPKIGFTVESFRLVVQPGVGLLVPPVTP